MLANTSRQPVMNSAAEKQKSYEQLDTLLKNGRKVTIVGVTPLSNKRCTYIVAGTTSKSGTGETRPVAICIDDGTVQQKRSGEPVDVADVLHLQEHSEIIVEGKKSKHGVIHATRMVV
jgi:hypothetical protein